MYRIYINNGDKIFIPSVADGVTWETERGGVPGKLTFEVYQDDILNFEEGNPVMFKDDNKGIVYAFIFIKQANPEKGTIKVTCYDQLIYLKKNKDTYQYSGLTADQLIKLIADDFRLNYGDLANTGFELPTRIEEDKTLIDMMIYALDTTLKNAGKLYELYDDFGKLALNNIENLKLDILIDEETATNYTYTSSLEDAYNKIKVVKGNEETGNTDVYIAQDSSNMNKWGVLQYYIKADDGINPKNQADILLALKNKKKKKLVIKGVLGDTRLRAGASPIVLLDLGDTKISNYMLIDKAKHTFKDDEYTCDLTVVGGDFNVS